MEKIDGISYPDTPIEILADPHLGPMFRAYLKKKGTEEKYIFLDAVAKNAIRNPSLNSSSRTARNIP